MEVAKRNPQLQFVVTGKAEGFTKLGVDKLKTSNIHFTGYLTDGEIKALMQNCRAFIHPAIYEGFGIPPLEAMSCGADLIISTATCLPEIYENSAHYIDPYDYDVDLEKLLAEPISPASDILDKFSWEREAEKLYKILK
jgi:glycosyltransferase involved in cell wall biosynthesis